jgi:MOSC domain-containing protein YiiM
MSTIDAMFAGSPRHLGPRAELSAIVKVAVPGPWRITAAGLRGDEQADKTNHGGPDKALHHYPVEHYATWEHELPALAQTLAQFPAFGENISTAGMTEMSVCIGDIYAAGRVRLQIAQGRQPCWKLNARFDIADMAVRVQHTGRTGWYYRVLTAGSIEPGTSLILEERPQPEWPLARLIQLLYTRTDAFDDLATVAALPQLAEGWRKLAARRVASRSVESWSRRLHGDVA